MSESSSLFNADSMDKQLQIHPHLESLEHPEPRTSTLHQAYESVHIHIS